jgi:pimeloyl-ACP methyl ester carboxylesterase
LLDAFDLCQPFVLGHSLGAETAAVAAALSPGRIAQLVLEDPPWQSNWTDDTAAQRRASIQEWQNDVRLLQAMSESDAWERTKRDLRSWPEEELRPWLESKRQFRLVAFESAVGPRRLWQETVGRIVCPTLLLSGNVAKGGLVSPEVGRTAMALNSNFEWHPFVDAGHNIHRDCFTEYVRLVEAYLFASS